MKAFLKSTILFIAGIVFSLVVGELFLRVAAPQRLDSAFPQMFEPHKELVFAIQKHFRSIYSNNEFSVPVETNGWGFRDKEFDAKDSASFRIVGLGDSYTFGNGVRMEETYLRKLEGVLPDFKGLKTDILNCGVPAYSPWQIVQLQKTLATELRPNLVTFGFFVGNDFTESIELFDEQNEPTIRVENGWLVSRKSNDEEKNFLRRVTGPIRYFLSTRSHLYVFLRNRSSQLIAKAGLQPLNLLPDFCETEYSERMNRGWNTTQSIMLEAAETAKVHHHRLVVIILPTSYQVYPEIWDKYISGMKINPLLYDLDKPQRILKEFFTQHNIEFVDALPILRKEAAGPLLFFPIDGHLTAEGHKVVANAVRDYLRSTPGLER